MKGIRNIRNIIGILLLINITVIIGYIVLFRGNKENDNKNEAIVDKIDNFDYTLDNSKGEYYKENFSLLKKELNKAAINYEEYAKIIAKLYIIDFYTLSDKISSGDVGGVGFVYKDFRKDFISIAKTSIYNSIMNNVYGNRDQELPTVNEVSIKEIKKDSFSYEKNNLNNSYYINAEIEYEKDLGYPTKCSLVLINNNKVLEVASVK